MFLHLVFPSWFEENGHKTKQKKNVMNCLIVSHLRDVDDDVFLL